MVGELEGLGAVGGDRAQHRQAQHASDLVGDVDDPEGESGVGRRHLRHRDREQGMNALPVPSLIPKKARKMVGKKLV